MKSSINFRVVKGGLKFSGSPYSGGKLSLKNRAPNMVHLGAVRLKNHLEYQRHATDIIIEEAIMIVPLKFENFNPRGENDQFVGQLYF
jgi:hypothetical protein